MTDPSFSMARRACLALPLGVALGAAPRLAPAASNPLEAAAGASAAPGVEPAPAAAARRPERPLPAPGQPLFVPAVELLDGTRFDPAAADQVLVLYWWASWCPFCAIQSPYMQAFWLAHRERGLAMLTLSIDKKPQDAAAYLTRKGLTFPVAWVDAALGAALPKPKGLPVTIVRGRDGLVLQAESGQLFPEDVEEMARWL